MKTTFTVTHMQDNDIVRGHFQDRVEKMAKYVKRYKDDQVYLHATLDKNPHKNDEFHASLSLYLPLATLHCREKGEDYATALNEAFLAISRQITRHKDKMNREKRRTERRVPRP